MSAANKLPYMLNQPCNFQLQVCISMFDLLLSLLGGEQLLLCDFSSILSAQNLEKKLLGF